MSRPSMYRRPNKPLTIPVRISRRNVIVGAVATTALTLPAYVGPKTHEVRIQNFAFVPERLLVRVGDKIRWLNEDHAPHTATADAFG